MTKSRPSSGRTALRTAGVWCRRRRSASPTRGNARWHWFALKADEPRPLFAFAGIYRQWKDPIKKAGPNVDIEVFSFMTTLPNALTSTINHERSPVLLTSEAEYGVWLSGAPEEAFGVIKTSDPERMHIVRSGFDKEDLLTAA